MRSIFTINLIVVIANLCFGQNVSLVKDINPNGSSLPVFDVGAISWQGKVLFAADDGTSGTELWVTDGTGTGTMMVKDINPGSLGSDCRNFFATSNFVFFTASDDLNGLELWITDGTAAGTMLVKNINTGSNNGVYADGSSQKKRFYVWNEILYFSGDNGTDGIELWKSDGTPTGTVMVKNIYSGNQNSFPSDFEAYNGKLYFKARNSMGDELWVTDGTDAGTSLLKDIDVGVFGSSPSNLIACNGYLLFTADDGDAQEELWRSDGTPSGTVMVKDIDPSQFASGLQTQPNTFEKRLVKMGDVVYFSADDGVNGKELWRSDGTDIGTFMVKDASSDPDGYAPQNFAVLNDVLYYKYNDGMNGIEFWRSDGTENGTFMVKNIASGSISSFSLPTTIVAVENAIWFNAESSSSIGNEIWTSDGTEQGTVMVSNINPGSGNSYPYQFVGLPDLVFFGATGPQGTELYKIALNLVPLSISISVDQPVLCKGSSTGSLNLDVQNGALPLTITWNPSIAEGLNPTNLPAGDYSVTVTDNNGSMATGSIFLDEPSQIQIFTNTLSATHSDADGSASVTAFGGTPPYSYSWSNGVTNSDNPNIVAGTYTVTVTDANGCTVTATAIVEMETGVDEIFANSIKVLPNIINSQFMLSTERPLYNIKLELIDLNGGVVKKWSDVNSGQLLQIDQRVSGNYYLKVADGDKIAVKKVVLID